jgi:hypothetical protein
VRLPIFIFVSLTCLLSTHNVSAAPKEQVGNNLPQIDTRNQPLQVFAKSLFYLETMYVDEDKVKTDAMITNALKGIVEKLDPKIPRSLDRVILEEWRRGVPSVDESFIESTLQRWNRS